MERFIAKHKDKIVGVLECCDRLLLKGYLPFPNGESVEALLDRHGILYKDFKRFVTQQSDRLKTHARQLAGKRQRPIIPIRSGLRKEDHARQIAERDGIREGLVCVFTALENCFSFKMRPGPDKPRLTRFRLKCQHLYYYFMDRDFGLMHVRLQTWFPFMIQICVNGHEWLARKMDRHGIAYERIENAFAFVSDWTRAQRFADAMLKKDWVPALEAVARRVNPLTRDLLAGLQHYWVIDQAEFATDLLFKDRAALQGVYPVLVHHASLCFSAEDVMTFLGRKLHPAFQGELQGDCRKRVLGTRVRHAVKGNSLKMYDKHGLVLRVETVINQPREFKTLREGTRRGQRVLAWFPMGKGIANLARYAEVSRSANHRYLDALSVVDDPSAAYGELHDLCHPVPYQQRRRRGMNPLNTQDAQLFAAALRGEHTIKGFQNRSLQPHLYASPAASPGERRKRRARVSRLIQLLRAHHLAVKIPHTQRYRLTPRGIQLMSAALYLGRHDWPIYPDRFAA
jgi:hypothetical protein